MSPCRRLAVAAPALAAAALVLTLAALAEARPGGGESYSGGSGGSSGGSSGSGGSELELVFFLVRLAIHYPALGVPLLLIVVAYFIYKARRGDTEAWSSQPATLPAPTSGRGDLEAIAALDPDFSPIVFEDFVYRLFAAAHQARTSAQALDGLAPYLAEPVRAALRGRSPGAVARVVIGAMRPLAVEVPIGTPPEGEIKVRLAFEANMVVGDRRLLVEEVWTLARDAAARSRPPEAVRTFGCPNCGAPFHSGDSQRCDRCGEVVTDGRFDWQVRTIRTVKESPLAASPGADVPEAGNQRPTLLHPRVRERWAALTRDDPAVTQDALRARVILIHRGLNTAWSALDAAAIRPFVSDGMFDYLRYWIDEYRSSGQRNVLQDMRVERLGVVKVTRDRHYDAITVRIAATGIDYTVDARGKVLRGSKSRPRPYSEYWTLIRGAGVRGAPRADANCPQCGAPLKISMAGACEYCGALVTRGDFDWVLSKIEQDESYAG